MKKKLLNVKTIAVALACVWAVNGFAKGEPVITVVYDGNNATVTVPDSLKDIIKYEIKGAHVNIKPTDTNEYEYSLSGNSNNGSFTLINKDKCKVKIELAGLNLTSQKGAALDVEVSKTVEIKVKKGTENNLVDCKDGDQKACIYVKGHAEFTKKGVLNVTGNTKQGIKVSEYMLVDEDCNINILGAPADGIHCGKAVDAEPGTEEAENNYFIINSGKVTVKNVAGDCIDTDDYGCVNITGGELELYVDHKYDPNDSGGVKAIKVPHTFTMTGGTVNIDVKGEDNDGIKVNQYAYFNGGTININVDGDGCKGIKIEKDEIDGEMSHGYAEFNGTDITITAKGGSFKYEEDVAFCNGMAVEGDMIQTAGTIKIDTTGDDITPLYTTKAPVLKGGELIINGQPLAIQDLIAVDNLNSKLFNLSGQMVNESYRGVVIYRGKKMFRH